MVIYHFMEHNVQLAYFAVEGVKKMSVTSVSHQPSIHRLTRFDSLGKVLNDCQSNSCEN